MKLDTDRVVSLTALIVGLGSLFIIYQTTFWRVSSGSVGPQF